ncbi:hypothetical protein DQG23_32705 [Paenibacillus contaminans]|uniref:Uncharacterized protein n=1 Tax=Paenibacillus contaminans TaxID=450362 RepID=A0A329M1S2_9BACL|nr:hypothetical protein DQG23_32705 [Paenibacillus contaminans]
MDSYSAPFRLVWLNQSLPLTWCELCFFEAISAKKALAALLLGPLSTNRLKQEFRTYRSFIIPLRFLADNVE